MYEGFPLVGGIRVENGQFLLDGYPEGAAVHGIEGEDAKELRRLAVFMTDIRRVKEWLDIIPIDPAAITNEQGRIFEGLADAALIAFCRCFDLDHPLKPLKPKRVFSIEQRDQLDRVRAVRNKVVAHDARLFGGIFSLIVRSRDFQAIEAVSMHMGASFVAFAELRDLRSLNKVAFDWITAEHEAVATRIVRNYNASPIGDRISAPPFTINVETKDHFAPKKSRAGK